MLSQGAGSHEAARSHHRGSAADHRSDIFSFGAILYELLSGKRAFKRDTNAETMAAIMRDEPPELSESGRSISPALDRIVKHCLEKDRESRFQTARDIAFSLSEQFSPAVTSGSREIAPPISSQGLRIAVLPFKYGDASADLAALADGLSEEIVTGLSRFRYLSVVASASADRLKGETGDERALGRSQLEAVGDLGAGQGRGSGAGAEALRLGPGWQSETGMGRSFCELRQRQSPGSVLCPRKRPFRLPTVDRVRSSYL